MNTNQIITGIIIAGIMTGCASKNREFNQAAGSSEPQLIVDPCQDCGGSQPAQPAEVAKLTVSRGEVSAYVASVLTADFKDAVDAKTKAAEDKRAAAKDLNVTGREFANSEELKEYSAKVLQTVEAEVREALEKKHQLHIAALEAAEAADRELAMLNEANQDKVEDYTQQTLATPTEQLVLVYGKEFTMTTKDFSQFKGLVEKFLSAQIRAVEETSENTDEVLAEQKREAALVQAIAEWREVVESAGERQAALNEYCLEKVQFAAQELEIKLAALGSEGSEGEPSEGGETPSQETPAQETPAQETPAQETPAQETPAQETRGSQSEGGSLGIWNFIVETVNEVIEYAADSAQVSKCNQFTVGVLKRDAKVEVLGWGADQRYNLEDIDLEAFENDNLVANLIDPAAENATSEDKAWALAWQIMSASIEAHQKLMLATEATQEVPAQAVAEESSGN